MTETKTETKTETRGDLVVQLTNMLVKEPENIPYALGYLLGSTPIEHVQFLVGKLQKSLTDDDETSPADQG